MRSVTAVKAALAAHQIELPSWAFGNSGTRFKVFGQPGVPRTPQEKIEDAAQVHKYTGSAPSVALHIPWDKVDDYAVLAAHAVSHGIRIGTINSNTFQDDDYRLGSVANADPGSGARRSITCLSASTSWTPPGRGTSSCGSPTAPTTRARTTSAGRQDRLAESLAAVYERLGPDQRLVLEYKLFEPSFYSTDVPDWGTSLLHCVALGPKAAVIVDTGHHAPGTNIEFIVAVLLRAGRLGGFDFNSRFYADDDLMVGAADPFQLFRIMHRGYLGRGAGPGRQA